MITLRTIQSMSAELQKLAFEGSVQQVKDEKSKASPLKVLGSSLLGLAAGTTAGYVVPKAIDAALVATRGRPLPPSTPAAIAPFVGGAIGLATPLMHYSIMESMREAHMKRQEDIKRGRENS